MTSVLVKKELQLLRPVLVGAGIVFVLLYVVIPLIGVIEWYRWNGLPWWYKPSTPFWAVFNDVLKRLAGWMDRATPFAWVASLLFMPIVACNAFALERRERWDELVAMLPMSAEQRNRTKLAVFSGVAFLLVFVNLAMTVVVVIAKEILPELIFLTMGRDQSAGFLSLAGAVVLVSACVFWMTRPYVRLSLRLMLVGGIIASWAIGTLLWAVHLGLEQNPIGALWNDEVWRYLTFMRVNAFVGLSIGSFGLAWLLSAVTRSPSLSAAIALGAVDGTFVLLDGLRMTVNARTEDWVPFLLFLAMAWVGIAGVTAGMVLQTRKISLLEALP